MRAIPRPPGCEALADPADYGSPTDDEIKDITRGMPPALVKRFQIAATTLMMTKERFDDRTPWRRLVEVIGALPARWVTVEIINRRGEHETVEAYVNRGVGPHGFHLAMEGPSLALADLLEEIEKERERNSKNGGMRHGPSIKETAIRQSLARVTERHGTKKLLEQPISWIVDRVRYDWHDQHGADVSPPSDNTIRRVIELCLPDHPKVKKKNCKKPGS